MRRGSVKRIFYSAAAGDLIGSYENWRSKEQIQTEVARTYSGEFFELCEEQGIEALAVSHCAERQRLDDGPFHLRHLEWDWSRSGLGFHLQQLRNTIRFIRLIIGFRADVAIISDRPVYWWPLALLRLLGIDVVISLHVRMWPGSGLRSGLGWSVLLLLDRWFLRSACSGLLAVSKTIADDLNRLGNPAGLLPAEVFRPLYNPAGFGLPSANWRARPFRVLFLGRIEETKGVFEILHVAEHLRSNGNDDIRFDICGDGGALPELRRRVDERRLQGSVILHGQLERKAVLELMAASHVVVVPTHSNPGEGYNKVAAEAALAGRPVVTSAACPVIEDIRAAAVEVPVDEWHPYAEAILKLAQDETAFDALVQGSTTVRDAFFDNNLGWKAACKRLLQKLGYDLRS